jgi:hypothetical protein
MHPELNEYLGRCTAAVWEAGDYIAPELLEWAKHLLEHEPAEAMLATARAIVESGVPVPLELIERLRTLGTPVPAQVWPEGLDDLAIRPDITDT